MKKPLVVFVVVFFAYFQTANVYPFGLETHRALSDKAVQASNLNDFLIGQLNFSDGFNKQLSDGSSTRSIKDWVGEGSVREDDSNRFCNHFHNPLLAWDQAGLTVICGTNYSSVLWGQRPDLQSQNESEQFAWQNARQRYFDGLAATSQTLRDQKLSLAFRTLGQVIHLVQDAAVPAHTRNDAHPTFIDDDGLESFVGSILGTATFNQLTGVATRYNTSILSLSSNSLAPIPIAKIIDTDQPSAIPSAGTDVGMAEYSNGNFVSDDTIFTDFTFPRVESRGASFKEKGTTYFPKIAEGELVDHFVAQGRTGNYFLNDSNSLIYKDYAGKLLPRAVGYSAGLIDYFFRGRLEVVQSDIVRSDQSCTAQIIQVSVDVRNITPDEETGTGQIVGVVQSGTSFFVSPSQTVTLTRTPQRIVFDFSQSPLPNASPLFLTAVYKGPLKTTSGVGEDDAVIAGGRSLLVPPVLSPQNPIFPCPNGSVTFTACSGTPPYTWSTTKGDIKPDPFDPAHKSAVLTHEKPIAVAFVEVYLTCGSQMPLGNCINLLLGELPFDCNGNQVWLGGCSPSANSPGDGKNCTTTEMQTLNCVNPVVIPSGSCMNLPIDGSCDSGSPHLFATCDNRTQAIIDAGCMPCTLYMQGAIVTVTDATGASARTTVTAQ